MREIKFRAWIGPFNGEPYMQLPNQVETYENEVITFSGTVLNLIEDNIQLTAQVRQYMPEDIHVMQYIGDKDMDGKEIYENDILAYRDGEYSYDAIVKWDNEGLRYYMQGIEPEDNFNFEDIDAPSHRVIGNIHQNPELLNHL